METKERLGSRDMERLGNIDMERKERSGSRDMERLWSTDMERLGSRDKETRARSRIGDTAWCRGA